MRAEKWSESAATRAGRAVNGGGQKAVADYPVMTKLLWRRTAVWTQCVLCTRKQAHTKKEQNWGVSGCRGWKVSELYAASGYVRINKHVVAVINVVWLYKKRIKKHSRTEQNFGSEDSVGRGTPSYRGYQVAQIACTKCALNLSFNVCEQLSEITSYHMFVCLFLGHNYAIKIENKGKKSS